MWFQKLKLRTTRIPAARMAAKSASQTSCFGMGAR